MDLLIYFWLLTIFLFMYNLGRSYFTVVPVLNNWIWTEKWNYYRGLNRDKFLIFFFITFLSIVFAYLFIPKIFKSENWFDVITSLTISFLLQISMTFILERKAPYSPFIMLDNFIKHNFDFKIVNFKNFKISKTKVNRYIKKQKLQNRKPFIRNNRILEAIEKSIINNINEVKEIVTENRFLLTQSEFIFEIKNNSNLILSDVIDEYSISKESYNILKDFLYRNRISGKIIFTKSARNSPSVKEMFNFFSTFTNIFEMYKNDKITQEEVKNIMNEIVVGTYKNSQKKNPISKDNISNYIPKKNLGVKKG